MGVWATLALKKNFCEKRQLESLVPPPLFWPRLITVGAAVWSQSRELVRGGNQVVDSPAPGLSSRCPDGDVDNMRNFSQHIFCYIGTPFQAKNCPGTWAARWLTEVWPGKQAWSAHAFVVRPWQRAQAHCPRHNLWQGRCCRAQAPNTGEGTWRCCSAGQESFGEECWFG